MRKFLKIFIADKVLMGLTAMLLIITGVSGSLVIVKASGQLFSSNEVTALDFSNLTVAEITEWYETNFGTQEGLSFEEVYDEEIAEGKVIDQEPKAGEVVTVDSGLTITVSLGQDPDVEFELPDFLGEGYTLEMIEEWFTSNGFTNVTYEYVIDTESELYDVIAISVTGTVKRSDEILVTISIGSESLEVEVVDFTAMTVSEIQSWARTNLINVDFTYVFSSSYAQGTIINQSVDAGTTISAGSSITVTVSNGEGVTISNIKGYSLSQARTYASNNGLSISIKYTYSSSVSEGLVVSTSPSSGTTVAKGSTLTVYISQGPDPSTITVTVEDYSGKSESDLKSYLDGLGISYSKQTAVYSDTVSKGLVAYNTTGSMTLTSTVKYALSLGSYSIDLSDFEGQTLTSAQSVVSAANSLSAGITLKYTEVATEDYTVGTLYGCTVSSKTIQCNLSGEKAYISNNFSQYNGDANEITIASTTAVVQGSLGIFENLTIQMQSSTYTAGTVISVSVNGSTTFESGYYLTSSTKIVVTISSGSN